MRPVVLLIVRKYLCSFGKWRFYIIFTSALEKSYLSCYGESRLALNIWSRNSRRLEWWLGPVSREGKKKNRSITISIHQGLFPSHTACPADPQFFVGAFTVLPLNDAPSYLFLFICSPYFFTPLLITCLSKATCAMLFVCELCVKRRHEKWWSGTVGKGSGEGWKCLGH